MPGLPASMQQLGLVCVELSFLELFIAHFLHFQSFPEKMQVLS
jgi:hypothetical protein